MLPERGGASHPPSRQEQEAEGGDGTRQGVYFSAEESLGGGDIQSTR